MNQLKEVLDFIRSHYAEEITLKELADIACMSPTYFCKYFHQEMGKTPFAFLNEYRIKKAAILLDDSSLYVSDIAINCGFVKLCCQTVKAFVLKCLRSGSGC